MSNDGELIKPFQRQSVRSIKGVRYMEVCTCYLTTVYSASWLKFAALPPIQWEKLDGLVDLAKSQSQCYIPTDALFLFLKSLRHGSHRSFINQKSPLISIFWPSAL